MELRQLQHFVAVAEEGHFTRVARRANIVQSALSSSVRALEEELGAQLFVRTTRQVRLTAAGRVLLDKARHVLAAAREAREAVAAVAGLERGALSIGTVQSLPAFLDLPALLARFHAAFPAIEVRLCQGGTGELLEKVRAGALDLAVLPLCHAPADIATTLIACEALVLVCPKGHRLTRRARVGLCDLAEEPFVDFEPGWGTRGVVDRGFAQAGAGRRLAFEVSDLDTLLALVARGLGVALVPEAIARTRASALAVVELAEPELCWELVVAHASPGPATGAKAARDRRAALDGAPRAFLDLLVAPGLSEAAEALPL
ncbi:LysR family transcriptional regulator [Xanthobacter sp. V2C-8]|uniref:LysR family transcriptional regulator n=1 Tax=Xanthobacter albus TaxID=3119929 RepID=UPI00372A3627